MAADSTSNPVSRPPWDKRAWLIGGVGGGLITFLCAIGSSNTLEAAFPKPVYALQGVTLAFSIIVLPVVLACISRRNWLIWSFLPYTILLIVSLTSIVVDRKEFGGPDDWTPSFYLNLLAQGLIILVLCLPCVLVRLYLHRKHRLARVAHEVASAAPESLENVWPPLPKDPAN